VVGGREAVARKARRMNDLALFLNNDGGGLSRRETKNLSRLESATRYGVARVEATTDIQAAKTDGIAYVGRRAMQNVALLSQLEVQLGQTVPAAVSRLQAIADITAMGLSEVVIESVQQLR
jgi:hypothetical protein